MVNPIQRLFYLNCEDCDYYDKENDLCTHDECPIGKEIEERMIKEGEDGR